MARRLGLVLIILGTAALSQAAQTASEPFRGAYLRFSDLFDAGQPPADRIKSMGTELDKMKECGLNTVLPYATDTSGRALYPSKLIPECVYGEWDSLGVLVNEAHRRGMHVYPVQCPIPSGGAKPGGILARHPEWALRNKNGEPIGHISPASEEARKWVASVTEELANRYQLDGILQDYLRFPSEVIQLEDPSKPGTHLGGKELQSFKEARLTETARLISERARRARPGIRMALYTWGPQVTTNHAVAQNWPLWVERGYIDMVNVSGYCFTNNYGANYLEEFSKRMKRAGSMLRGTGQAPEFTFALGIKTSHGQIHRAAEVKDYLTRAGEAGATGFAAFTWAYLKPFYSQVNEAGYFRK